MRRSKRWTGREVERLLRDGVDPPGGDARLLHRYLAERDEAAFEAIVDRHGPLVLALCRRYLYDPADVDDAFQATFLVLLRKGAGLRDGDALSSWLYGVARRVAVRARSDVLRRRAREGGPDKVDEAVADPERPVDDSLETLDRELSRLPEKYRAPLVLCYLRGRTYDQAAAELGWPSGTVRSRMAKARTILHQRLTRQGVDASACLVLLKADLAASLVPPSLVAATVAAAGRFAGLGGLAWLASASSPWPAAALAQGAISTMSPSPWKLLGLACTSAALSAGAFAVASGALAAPGAQDKPPEAQQDAVKIEKVAPVVDTKTEVMKTEAPEVSVKAEEKHVPAPVDQRLDALEAKLDRMAALLARPAPLPPTAVEPNDRIAAAAPTPPGTRSVREIEAELVNAYMNYQRCRKLAEQHVVSQEELELAVQPIRVIMSRLLEIKDEQENVVRKLKYMDEEYRWHTDQRNVLMEKLTKAKGDPVTVAQVSEELRAAEASIERNRQEINAIQRGTFSIDNQSRMAERLIDWTKKRLPDMKMSIDDIREDPK
ncbi:sigma-70 family RNA polymerase sigma factor [Paludisphaera mucosa]|uniref:Sigma-70 family RNA polymerase sigma factor n=1 Tax=Paludisphaera mucosa TaxID=3030827 RepID=A0ABT6FC06_9BACT|nr:sigma-70 family RNA polymerase sigma factor [Paludisphaera mucosa]MDG3004915.1 sigma-70 family RNA polymerase sigma factor [Paludisphaera mucosa]